MVRGLAVALTGVGLLLGACNGCVDSGLEGDDGGTGGGAPADAALTVDSGPSEVDGGETDGGVLDGDAGIPEPRDAGKGGCVTACGTWVPTTTLPGTLNRHTATLLANGKVLVAGGDTGLGPSDDALLFDPGDESWTATGKLHGARYNHTASLLTTGEVLVIGGFGHPTADTFGALRTAEVYAPATGTWRQVASLPVGRSGHTATVMSDGTVLVVGGTSDDAYLTDVQLYAPMTSTFVQLGSIMQPRYVHAASELSNRRVLIVGGRHISDTLASSELFNVTAVMAAPDIPGARWGHSATTLEDGRVVVVGGLALTMPLDDAYLFNGMGWSAAMNMVQSRWAHEAVKLDDGRVLIVGGTVGGDGLSTLAACEVFDPADNSFHETAWMNLPRLSHSATKLMDGRVLVVGGTAEFDQWDSAEIYTP